MKSLKLTLLLNFVLFVSSQAQTVRIVDNNYNAPSGDLVYSTLQEAADAAVAGDIIYVQPSPTTYGDVAVNKELHFKGIGFNLDKDLPHNSNMGVFVFTNNVDNTSNSSGSTIMGINAELILMRHNTSGGVFELTDLVIDNCIIRGNGSYAITSDVYVTGGEVPITNLEIKNSDIRGTVHFQHTMTNMLLRNNLIRGGIVLDSSNPQSAIISNNIIYTGIRKDSQGDDMIIQNNNFIGQNGSNNAFSTTMIDAIVANNIFYGRTPSIAAGGASTSTSFQRNVFTNNLSYETGDNTLPPSGGGVGNSGDGNIVDDSPLFGNVPVLNSWDLTHDFSLSAGSPAIDAGSDGTDIGITGGTYPFNGSNFDYSTSPFPTIQILNTDAVINPSDNLDIRISIKAN